MSFKRGFEDHENEFADSEPKRAKARHQPKARQHQNAGIDPTWGQKYVFSELADSTTIPRGEEDDFEDDADAMAYLKSVRQQASLIPHLLVAPKIQIGPQLPAEFRTEPENSDEEGEIGEGPEDNTPEPDPRGFYEDGAYVGISAGRRGGADGYEFGDDGEQDGSTSEENNEEALRDAYLASVRNRFMRLRDMLRADLPDDATSRLPGRYAIEVPSFGRSSPTVKTWSGVLHNADPHPVQVALLSKDSVIRILRVILGGKFLRQGCPIPERTSRWLWALLARLPDQGELNHTEVGWIRDLGRRAILLGTNLVAMAGMEGGSEEEVFQGDGDANSEAEFFADVLADDGGYEDEAPKIEVVREAKVPDETGEAKEQGLEKGGEDTQRDKDDQQSSSGADDVAMDLASDTDADEGEIDEDADQYDEAALEEAKRALLARLVGVNDDDDERRRREEEARKERERMNTRATLHMIITVAGEYYGQRDLLEFREPYGDV